MKPMSFEFEHRGERLRVTVEAVETPRSRREFQEEQIVGLALEWGDVTKNEVMAELGIGETYARVLINHLVRLGALYVVSRGGGRGHETVYAAP